MDHADSLAPGCHRHTSCHPNTLRGACWTDDERSLVARRLFRAQFCACCLFAQWPRWWLRKDQIYHEDILLALALPGVASDYGTVLIKEPSFVATFRSAWGRGYSGLPVPPLRLSTTPASSAAESSLTSDVMVAQAGPVLPSEHVAATQEHRLREILRARQSSV